MRKNKSPTPGAPGGFKTLNPPPRGPPGFSKFKSPTPGYMGDFKMNIKQNNLKCFLSILYSCNTVDIPQWNFAYDLNIFKNRKNYRFSPKYYMYLYLTKSFEIISPYSQVACYLGVVTTQNVIFMQNNRST